jgi:hypothetical protein
MNVSTAVAASKAPEFDTSLVGIANVAAVGAMPSAAAVCVRVAAAMPVAMNTALHEHTINKPPHKHMKESQYNKKQDTPSADAALPAQQPCTQPQTAAPLQLRPLARS